MKALVLAGGGGEPLSVFTAERAVSAMPFGGKYRIIDFVLSNCSHSGVNSVAIFTQHAPTSLHDHVGVGRPWDLDHHDGGVHILQPFMTREHSGWYRGTADALAQNLEEVGGPGRSLSLVLAGDHVYRMDYRELQRFHQERGAALTLPVLRVSAEEASRFGMVTTDAGGRVRRFEEKPARTAAIFASMGIYLFDSAVLLERLRARPLDLVREVVIPLVESGERVFAFEFDDYWEDVGTVATYYRSSMELLAPEPRLRLYEPDWPILTRDEERPPLFIGRSAHVIRSLVPGGCRILGRVERSVLFPGVTVEAGATVRDAILFSDAVVRAGATVERAILDKYVDVGEEVRLGGAAGSRGGPAADLTLVGKDAAIPAGTRVGRGCVIGVGARAEAFAGREVPDGTLLGGAAGLGIAR